MRFEKFQSKNVVYFHLIRGAFDYFLILIWDSSEYMNVIIAWVCGQIDALNAVAEFHLLEIFRA